MLRALREAVVDTTDLGLCDGAQGELARRGDHVKEHVVPALARLGDHARERRVGPQTVTAPLSVGLVTCDEHVGEALVNCTPLAATALAALHCPPRARLDDRLLERDQLRLSEYIRLPNHQRSLTQQLQLVYPGEGRHVPRADLLSQISTTTPQAFSALGARVLDES